MIKKKETVNHNIGKIGRWISEHLRLYYGKIISEADTSFAVLKLNTNEIVSVDKLKFKIDKDYDDEEEGS